MQTAAMTSRFLTGCSSIAEFADSESGVGKDGLLHHIVASHLIQTVSSQELFVKLTYSLIQFAEQAYLRRDLDVLEEMSQVLMNLPVDATRQIGLYYHALAIKRKGNLDKAQTLLETVADKAPLNYRARAIQALGANYHDKGQLNEAVRFQLEALQVASDKNAHALQTTLLAHGEIAIVRSLAGDHLGALASFEKLWPLLYHVAKQNPFYFYVFHNELAVELGEAGRVEEAKAACRIALACPFASSYPEWTETRQELEAKRTSATTSVVAVNRDSKVEPSPQAEPRRKSTRVARLAFSWPARDETSLQRTSKGIVVTAAIPINGTTQSMLDRVLVCIGPRAPPRA
jgi:tetratricopeptide (TPR) repeat protein